MESSLLIGGKDVIISWFVEVERGKCLGWIVRFWRIRRWIMGY